ncbi:hypothetical protein [Jannaschia sp. M317]|uniref:hypothetical protein n=1 Tax=Jannaschia sp. M317 TaxID=2867011 RepID=UPI0021A4172B|nr:hypothetical protein [Jannaschia sp. M317]UWQ18075.1 hypothetical protein K3551_01845 [Jannaschia sp. M317]
MPRLAASAACAATLLMGTAALAEDYVLTIDGPLAARAEPLLAATNLTLIDSFEARGVHYVVLSAPSDVFVETFFSTYGTWPLAMHRLEGGWDSERYSAMPTERRLLQLEPLHCRFCLG